MARHITILIAIVVAGFVLISFTTSSFGVINSPRVLLHDLDKSADTLNTDSTSTNPITSQAETDPVPLSGDILQGGSIAPKLENATAKAELGRASWKLFHTMMARFPEKPTDQESLALKTYIQLFARLYPCGDCASHFQRLIKRYPPQVGSRNSAVGWACHVHNQVNARLEKPEFPCDKIGDFYDCGCGDDKKDVADKAGTEGKKSDGGK